MLVLYGDVPLINPDTLRQLIAGAGPKSLGLLTVMLDDPTGYGRIVRNARGAIQKIVEQKDATRAQLRIREGNSGIIAAPGQTTAPLARQAAQCQRAGRVLPDRRHRAWR